MMTITKRNFYHLATILGIIKSSRKELSDVSNISLITIHRACEGKEIAYTTYITICYYIGVIAEWHFEKGYRRTEVKKSLELLEPTADFRIRA